MGPLLALDLGDRRIGVAISDPTGTLARPLTTIIRSTVRADFEAVARLLKEHAAVRIVVGLPLSLNGTEGPQARKTRRYAQRLAQAIAVPIEFWDERHSSTRASEILRAKGTHRRPARGEIDAIAAAVILQAYLDAKRPECNA